MAKGLSRFGGLLGFGAEKPDDDKKDDKDAAKPARTEGESDEDYAKRCEEDEKKRDEDARKAAADPKDVNDDEKAQKAAATALETAIAAAHVGGIAAERTRWTTVLSAPQAEGKVVTACDLLADSDMEAAAIIKVLGKLGTVRTTLANRNPNPTPAPATGDHGDPTKASGPKGFAAKVQAAADLARGKKAS